jgi:hypothetical protein
MREGRLRRALDLFTSCGSDATCPDIIRKDCIARFDETNRALPTVTFAVQAGSREFTNVQVYAEDDLITTELDGRAVPLDPGKYSFRFVLPQGRVLSSQVVLREGEKNRLITVHAEPAIQPAPRSEAPLVADEPPGTRQSPFFWIASGIGLTAGIAGVVFVVLGDQQEQSVEDCAPACAPGMRANLDRAETYYTVANASFGVAAASIVTAAIVYFTTPSPAVKPPPVFSSVQLRKVAVLPRDTGATATATFSFDAL